MTVIDTGSTIDIYSDDELKTSSKLSAGTYKIAFHKMKGFFLEKNEPIKIQEKIYGNLQNKVDKAFKTFKTSTRNTGIILSGEKGIGKTVFTNLLSKKCIENDMPVLIANNYIPGINDFINSIHQEVLVIFDEFEKTFKEGSDDDKHGLTSSQEQLLSLFDGQAYGKKMFVVTCNEVKKLNKFLLNRPGRFHYHFKLNNPNENEIREYLEENLLEEYKNAIDKVVTLSSFYSFTYDILRAFTSELNQGYLVEETIEDLNFDSNALTKKPYNFTIKTTNDFEFRGSFDFAWLFGEKARLSETNGMIELYTECYYNNNFIDSDIKVNIPASNCSVKQGEVIFGNSNEIKLEYLPTNKRFFSVIKEVLPPEIEANDSINAGEISLIKIEENSIYQPFGKYLSNLL